MAATVPPVANEREGLLEYLAHERYKLKVTTLGLTEEQARATPTASVLSETLGSVIALYDDVAAETSEVIAGIEDLDHPLPVPPAPWNPRYVKEWSVRWVLLHMIEETARHAGHADITRETVDGATFYPLLAASEGWPETDWLKPWRPEASG